MSKVAIKGNASGTGTFTLEAPNSNTDRTLVLPDEAGTVLTSGTDVANFPSGFANGITSCTLFRVTSNVSTNTNPLTNWEKPSGEQFGDEATVSSGIFTFPSTGFYLVRFVGIGAMVPDDQIEINIQLSTDGGSNFDISAVALQSGDGSSVGTGSLSCETVVDVTSTSNVKIKVILDSVNSGSSLTGNTNDNYSTLSILRLGDT